jgi:hypothetical protein
MPRKSNVCTQVVVDSKLKSGRRVPEFVRILENTSTPISLSHPPGQHWAAAATTGAAVALGDAEKAGQSRGKQKREGLFLLLSWTS